jgi:hypothetical protein
LLVFVNISLRCIIDCSCSSSSDTYQYKLCIQEMLSQLMEVNTFHNNKFDSILSPSISHLSFLFSRPIPSRLHCLSRHYTTKQQT